MVEPVVKDTLGKTVTGSGAKAFHHVPWAFPAVPVTVFPLFGGLPMALSVTRTDIWVAGMKDRPGGLNEKLALLAGAGAQLEFVLARRTPEKPGAGVVFLAPVRGARQVAAAKKAGFHKSKSLCSLRVTGPDKPGTGAKITAALARKRINLRGISAAALGKRFVMYLALDCAADAAKAAGILRKM